MDPILITSIYKSRNCSTTASAIPTVIRAPPYRAMRSFLFLAFTGIAPRIAAACHPVNAKVPSMLYILGTNYIRVTTLIPDTLCILSMSDSH